ncbi:MAG TPA: monomethylamine:corrinoid methyltransferase [Nitrososphaerales archaeon]|nr:monomethylamine:corrinoid methyltransferase [Nitrososphaerales archaeon]
MDLLFDILDRTITGPPITKREFELKLVPQATRETLKEHGLEKTFDPNNPINTDLGLAKEFYRAGRELALKIGMFCPDTARRIFFDERELDAAVSRGPTEVRLGYGKDAATIRSRTPEDPRPPVADGAALGMSISEEYFVPLCMAIAQYDVIDMILAPTLDVIKGYEIRARTPYETIMGMYEARYVKEALARVGRPGLPLHGVEGAPTEYGYFGGYLPGGFEPDRTIGIALVPEPLILSYQILHRVTVNQLVGAALEAGHVSTIGGYFGSPEGVVVGTVAAQILQKASMFPTVIESTVVDSRYFGNTGREALWASSTSMQARSSSNRIMNLGITSQVSGPCTEMLLRETAAIAIADSVSGVALEIGTRPAACRYKDYGSALENKFFAEVLKSSARNLKLPDANEIVKALLPKYEDKLRDPPKGKSFPECTDLRTLRPSAEWAAMYDGEWNELVGLGLPRWS